MNQWINDVMIVYLLCALPLFLLIGITLACRLRVLQADRRKCGYPAFVAALIVVLVVPWSYASMRTKQRLERLNDYVSLSRFREALQLATVLEEGDGKLRVNGRPISDVRAELNRMVAALEAGVIRPLSRDAGGNERLDRARMLAMLGRADEAVELLIGIEEPLLAAQAANLLGVLSENQEQWDAAAEAFALAHAAWRKLPDSDQTRVGIIEATRGLAFAQRKSGHYDQAAATYRELLALSPTADMHYLLAQFYVDSQDAEAAWSHARQAAELSPANYEQKAMALVNDLQVRQFGCLNVFRSRKSSTLEARLPTPDAGGQ